jgi:hypothetical protein
MNKLTFTEESYSEKLEPAFMKVEFVQSLVVKNGD